MRKFKSLFSFIDIRRYGESELLIIIIGCFVWYFLKILISVSHGLGFAEM
jgi:hypothetical protein